MRIRKQAKLSGIRISNIVNPFKLSCQLNQNPWDVLFSPPQIGGECRVMPEGSSGNSIGVVESVDPNGDIELVLLSDDNVEDASLCVMTDGKTWKCMHEVAEGHDVCMYHLGQSVATTAITNDRTKKRATQKMATPPDSVYYFYSEFGPWWTKQRGAKGSKDRTKPIAMEVDGEKRLVNDFDSDEDENGRIKRARKPIKARSLKSLM